MEQDILKKSFAEKRRKQISGTPHYNLNIKLEKNSKTYTGNISIQVSLNKKEDLKVDTISKIKKIIVNGNLIEDYKQTPYSLTILKKNLSKDNLIEIYYEAKYDKTGDGFHHFIDPEDNNEYLYSNFEPYDAHRMFPCFDQPDIKATYQLSVTHPKDWKVISNSWPEKTKSFQDTTKTHFKKTPKFSTYLFHLSAGPYAEFKSTHKRMPIRVLCRQSLKKYIPHKDIFTITKQGLDFYSKYFSYPYPFDKYDQIYVPEFNSGAMENVGAVTFSERLLARRALTQPERSSLANVILHEMVHMWFGDLVTMKWWNDVWLNESFADFLSYIGMYKATEFTNAWEDFYARKAWAYVQDQLPTTHPIANDAADTDIAFANFDGISYAKGAATLKQFLFYIGEESFKKGLKMYFHKYQWQNTELKDFLRCMEKASGKNLKPFFKSWIDTTGVNSNLPEYKIRKGKLHNFKIKQFPSAKNNLLRKHKTQISLYYGKQKKTLPVFYKGKYTKIKQLQNTPIPDFIHLNDDDHDYIKIQLDRRSLNYVINNLSQIPDQLTKQMIYGALWQMVRDAQLSPKKYLELIYKNAPKEKSLFLLERLVMRASLILSRYVNEKDYKIISEEFHKLAWKTILDKKTISETKSAWFDLILGTYAASSNLHKEDKLVNLLKNKTRIPGLTIDPDKRWRILSRLAVTSHKELPALLKKEISKDKSDNATKSHALIQATLLKNKEKTWNCLVKQKGTSLDTLRNQMSGFYWRNQKPHLKKYKSKFFSSINSVFKLDRTYAKTFFTFLFPHLYTSPETIKQAKAFLHKNPKAPQLLRKSMLESIDEMQRTQRILDKFS